MRSSWPSCRSDEVLLISLICSEWRIHPILGLVGMRGFHPCQLLEELHVTVPAPPRGCLWVLRLFWGAGIVLGCWARNSRKSGTGQTSRGCFDAGWDSELGLVQDPALQPSHPQELPLNSCPT